MITEPESEQYRIGSPLMDVLYSYSFLLL